MGTMLHRPRLGAWWLAGAAALLAAQGVPAQTAAPPAQSAAPAAASTSAPAPMPYASVAQALAALRAADGDGTVVTEANGWITVTQPPLSTQWTFTTAGHPAHPALVRRVMRRGSDGKPGVETQLLCEAPAEACAALQTQFDAMNERLLQGARARARQGSSVPP